MKISEIQKKLSKDNVILKSRSYTFDTKKYNSNNPMKVNIGNIYMPGNNTMRNNINIIDVNNENNNNNNKQNTFLNINKLPTIISRLSVSNFHKRIKNNKEKDLKERNNMDIINKLNVFNKTSIIGFKGVPFDNGSIGLRNANYNINDPNTYKLLNSHKEINKYKIFKEEIMNQNNINIINNINSYNNINRDNKEKKKYHINKNSFNTKTIIHNNNKYYNNINKNQMNNYNLILVKKDEIKEKVIKKKENEEKNNIYEENNDSFLNELNVLISNVKSNNDSQQYFKNFENNKNNDSDDDREPDPRINFAQINKVNESRPQTSYGGINVRRKNLKSAIQNVRTKNNNIRPSTCNNNL